MGSNPNGGGGYMVARANLGVMAGLLAAAALLTDYVLTVAVSVSSGVQAVASAFPVLFPLTVPIIVGCIVLVMALNLRGIRESGTVFAAPTYIFLGTTLLMLGLGITRSTLGNPPLVTGVSPVAVAPETLSLLLMMRAFADGCSAMTGTEAVANGVPAFKPPEWKNAQTTMLVMGCLLGTMFLGTSYLATVSGAVPAASGESVLSQIGRSVFGLGPLYYVLQFSTMGILVLAAQTSFADFPRVASILARDEYFPRQFAFRGERLAFNAGIFVLAFASIVLVVAFGGQVTALIPLYAIGVFTAFTLSQTGMVRHWWTTRGPGWKRSIFFNAVGATATFTVTIVFAIAKFALGAWIIIVVVPILVGLMLFVHRQYMNSSRELQVRRGLVFGPPHRHERVVIPVPWFNRSVVQAVNFGRAISDDVLMVHVTDDLKSAEELRARIDEQLPGVPLVIVESPFRSLVQPFVTYLDVTSQDPEALTLVIIPEYVARHWWERILYNQTAQRLRTALLGRPNTVVASVPYRREDPHYNTRPAEAVSDVTRASANRLSR